MALQYIELMVYDWQATDVDVSIVSKCVYNSSRNPPQMNATTGPTTPAE